MTPDNSGIDYAGMLLFVFGFLVYWKFWKILKPLPTPDLLRDYKWSRQCCLKTKCDIREIFIKVLFK